jgi:hypothetical protein
MGGGAHLDGDAGHAALDMHGDWARSVWDTMGRLCGAQAMLGRLPCAQTHSARVRFHRNVALVQLAAWVVVRMTAMAADDNAVDNINNNDDNNDDDDDNDADAEDNDRKDMPDGSGDGGKDASGGCARRARGAGEAADGHDDEEVRVLSFFIFFSRQLLVHSLPSLFH